MSRGYPSRTALLALLAVVGYQNRDKIAGWIPWDSSRKSSMAPLRPSATRANWALSSGSSSATVASADRTSSASDTSRC